MSGPVEGEHGRTSAAGAARGRQARRLVPWLAVTLVVAAFWAGPHIIAARLNPTLPMPGRPVDLGTARLHETLNVADLHTDALLWSRDLRVRGRYGHVDVPRLVEGRVAVQGFTVVTRVPRGVNVDRNEDRPDQIGPLAVLQRWPARTWRSPLQRALHQADKLHRLAADSRGRLAVLGTRGELDAFLGTREPGEATVLAFLGLEGAHALEGEVANVDLLFEAGFRMIGLTHFFDNEVGGSAHGVAQGGLTPFGDEVLGRMAELGMIVDLAHASPRLIDDVVARAGGRPVLVSHTGVDGTCPGPRNLDDTALRAIAATGGVVGIGLWPEAVCGTTPEAWARAVRHAADRMGADHVALGSDWDGAVPAIVDAAGTVHLTAALLAQGFSEEEIRGIMGENTVRVLRSLLPRDPPPASPRPEPAEPLRP